MTSSQARLCTRSLALDRGRGGRFESTCTPWLLAHSCRRNNLAHQPVNAHVQSTSTLVYQGAPCHYLRKLYACIQDSLVFFLLNDYFNVFLGIQKSAAACTCVTCDKCGRQCCQTSRGPTRGRRRGTKQKEQKGAVHNRYHASIRCCAALRALCRDLDLQTRIYDQGSCPQQGHRSRCISAVSKTLSLLCMKALKDLNSVGKVPPGYLA